MRRILAASTLLLFSFCASAWAQPFPTSFSWANVNGNNYLTPPKSQGSCYSCQTFAAVGVLEAMLKIRGGAPSANPDLSEQYVVNCTGLNCDNGIDPFTVLDFLASTGTCPEACVPYVDDDGGACGTGTCQNPIMNRAAEWGGMSYPAGGVTVARIDSIKAGILRHGPLIVDYNVVPYCVEERVEDPPPCDWRYPESCPHECPRDLWHAWIIYGWTESPTDSVWLVKNSAGGGGFTTLSMTRSDHEYGHSAFWLEPMDVVAPAAVACDVQLGHTTTVIAWTASGDDTTTGTATYYEVRRASAVINSEAGWNGATVVDSGSPGTVGTMHCFQDTDLNSCQAYYYAVRLRDEASHWSALGASDGGTTRCSNSSEVMCDEGLAFGPPTEDADLPAALEFRGAVPNPVTSDARFELVIPGHRSGAGIELALYDISGRRVKTLLHGSATPGRQTIHWDRSTDQGQRVEPGCYFARLKVGDEIRRSVLLVTGR